MHTTLNCQGLSCPAPVIQTKERIEQDRPARISVTVDNDAAVENVGRFLESQRYSIALEREGSNFTIVGTRDDGVSNRSEAEQPAEAKKNKIMVMVSSDGIGTGDDELGGKLMLSFLKTLKEMGPELWRLVFVNNSVKLTIGGSEALQDLKDLENQGIHILVCGTCLSHFNLLEKKEVGQTTNMLDIITAMQVADKVINM
jgi:selenium metabolism protein YedF